jgi:TP901 family phage tail tape measure protein
MAVMLGTASAQVTLDISQFMAAAGQAEGKMNQLAGAGTGGTGRTMFDRLTTGALGLGTALIAPMTLGLKTAVDLEQQLANVDAALGDISDNDLGMLADQFNQIAIESQYSAVQVAAVGEELAKAGVAQDVLVETTDAVIALSQATGAPLQSSLAAVTTATAIWAEGMVDAEHVITDVTETADILTTVTNSTRASMDDINAGMRPLAAAAARAGLSYNETAAAIGFFVDMGLTGADAGVSLARSLTELADPTSEAALLMEELGIQAYDLATGEFIGFPALFDQLNAATADMTDQQKEMVLTTIFGAEAIDVMGIAALTGGDALRTLIEATKEVGTAFTQAGIRMDTLKAQFGTLVEGIGTLLGSFVSGLIPGLRLVVDFANVVVDALLKIPQPIKTVVGAIAGFLAGMAAITRAVQAFRALNFLMTGLGANSATAALGMRGIALGLSRFIPLVGLAAAGWLVWEKNLFGIQGKFKGFISGLKEFGTSFRDSYRNLTEDIVERTSRLSLEITDGMARIPAFFLAFGNALGVVAGDVPILGNIADGFLAIGDALLRGIPVWERLRSEGVDPVHAGITALAAAFPQLQGAISAISPVIETLSTAFTQFISGDFVAGLNTLIDGLVGAISAIDIGSIAVSIGSWVVSSVADLGSAIFSWVTDTAIPAIGTAAATIWDVIVNIGSWAQGVISDLAPYVATWAESAVSGLTTAAATIWNVLVNIGSWAKGVVSDLAPYVVIWATEAIGTVTSAAGTVWNVLVNRCNGRCRRSGRHDMGRAHQYRFVGERRRLGPLAIC